MNLPQTSDSKSSPVHPPQARSMRWWLSRFITPVLVLGVGILLIVSLGIAQKIGWISSGGSGSAVAGATDSVYTCPMHPQIRQNVPGNCPICGMPLEIASSGGSAIQDKLAVKITPAARRLAQIEVSVVKAEEVFYEIETVGAIAVDESRQATISSYIDGRVERMFADYTGVQVALKDHLAVLYSPELYSAQVEYLQSRKALSQMSDKTMPTVRRTQLSLVQNSKQKLSELGMTAEQIAEIEKTKEPKSRLTIYTPIEGTVLNKMVVEGQYVKAGDPIYRVADLKTVWLMMELFPEDVAQIRFGQEVEAEVQSLPGELFMGRVAFIDPIVNPQTRTVGVRVEFLNLQGKLRPGDYASATIRIPIGGEGKVYDAMLAGKWISPMHPQVIRDKPGVCPICGMDLVPTSQYGFSKTEVETPLSLVIPRSAVLMAGEDSVAYVEKEEGVFEIRPLTLGTILKDSVVVLGGLKEGEKVAVAGNFLIDSQMQLEGKPSLIDVSRAVELHEEKSKGPLDLKKLELTLYSGETGNRLETLYKAYLPVQKNFTEDKKPTEKLAAVLHQTALKVSNDSNLSESQQELATQIVTNSEHLHHVDLEKARQQFKPISHAILKLAAQARGDQAKQELTHFFCPMVKGGGGDWLQAGGELFNPYYGSQMLHCGENVEVLPLQKPAPEEPKQ